MRRIATLLISAAAAPLLAAPTTVQTDYVPTWYEQFAKPTDSALPWTFWYWMYGNVSDEGIRLDLQAMKEASIKGFYLMPIKSTADGKGLGGDSDQLSPEW